MRIRALRWVVGCLVWFHTGCCLLRTPVAPERPVPCPVPKTDQLKAERAAICESPTYQIPASPDAVRSSDDVEYWDMPLQAAIQQGLVDSDVLHDLGGTVLRSPGQMQTVLDPSIVYTDPRVGEEAALSAFDANFRASSLFDNNDRLFNNRFLGNNGLLQQELGNFNVELSKRSATGTAMALRNVSEYDENNSIGNRFGSPSSSWTTFVDAEIRQPFLQGAGLLFNRMAGPSDQPGVVNGVLVARTRTDTSLAEFESGVRNLVSDIENAYWDLYFAYQDFDVKKQARDHALRTYTQISAKYQGDQSGESQLQQALEQYWRFEAELLDSLHGRLLDGTRTNNGSAGGTFRNSGGVRLAERRLRLLLGLPINDGRLIRPSDDPPMAPVAFDWDAVATEALVLRPEIRRQEWVVKQREMELSANRNFLLPQLDGIGRYRWRGFGRDFASQSDAPLSSAWGNLADGDFQEWQVGMELSMPLGFRRAHAAVRNSELQLARERALLTEQKQNVMLGLSNAVNDVQRAFQVLQAQYNRHAAAAKQVATIEGIYLEGNAPLDLLLEAQRRQIDADTRYYQARVEYALALKNVHFEKGSLLEYNQVLLSEGDSSPAAYALAAARRERQRLLSRYALHDLIISAGPAGIAPPSPPPAPPAPVPLPGPEHPSPVERLPIPPDTRQAT